MSGNDANDPSASMQLTGGPFERLVPKPVFQTMISNGKGPLREFLPLPDILIEFPVSQSIQIILSMNDDVKRGERQNVIPAII
jgi:hypothetical protein